MNNEAKAETELWKCFLCGRRNTPDRVNCEACLSTRPPAPLSPQPSTPQSEEDARFTVKAAIEEGKRYEVLLMSGVEGPSIYINEYRVCGPKPWGGGRVEKTWWLTVDDLKRAIPELRGDS